MGFVQQWKHPITILFRPNNVWHLKRSQEQHIAEEKEKWIIEADENGRDQALKKKTILNRQYISELYLIM